MDPMTFSNSLVSRLSEKNLLKHELYQAWSAGTVSMETLRLYAGQYYHHVKAFPRYVSATHSNCDQIKARQVLLENLNDEESGTENHPELWLRFAEGLGASRSQVESADWLPETRALVDTFFQCVRSSYAEGLGALFAYEHQIPEIAAFKMEALQKHYGIHEAAPLSFFETHRQADVFHTQALSQLLDDLSDVEKQKAEESARKVSDHLWKFLDGIQRNSPPVSTCSH